MRKIAETQTDMFNKSLETIKIDLHCRDELPTILLGLQELYRHPDVLKEILCLLESLLPKHVSRDRGRCGMNFWKILVLGVVKLTSNCDFDKLSDLAGNHNTLRLFLHEGADSQKRYPRQTLVDNLSLFTPEVLELINREIIKLGHHISGSAGPTECRVDSFVVETDVHFPTDLSLIWDGIRVIVRRTAQACHEYHIPGWREHRSIIRKIKKQYRECQLVRRSKPRKEATKKLKRGKEIVSVQNYLTLIYSVIRKVKFTISTLSKRSDTEELLAVLNDMIQKTEQVAHQLMRRILDEEKIPHDEKIFSFFEPYTEWISKGKAGTPQELGVRVSVAEDELGFLLSWRTMFKETDEKVTVPIAKSILKQYQTIKIFSFDKGYYSVQNSVEMKNVAELLILPSKGNPTKQQKADAKDPEYKKYRRKHARIESAIHALENHGLDRCLDKGKVGFERYVALAIAARNLLQIGSFVKEREIKKEHKKAG